MRAPLCSYGLTHRQTGRSKPKHNAAAHPYNRLPEVFAAIVYVYMHERFILQPLRSRPLNYRMMSSDSILQMLSTPQQSALGSRAGFSWCTGGLGPS